MKLQIESTDKIMELDGVPFRVWQGVSEQGVPCLVLENEKGTGAYIGVSG